MPKVTIELVEDPVRARQAEDLQRAVWGMSGGEVVPHHQIITAARWGGMLLIAYLEERPVGFCYAFVGLDERTPVLCSHMTGVLPELRSHGIGFELKMAQRRLAEKRGLERIVWTFDPLEARNAYLNLHKLDAFARRYHVDHYGPMDDDVNRGVPSDRLLVEWDIGASRPSADRAPSQIDDSGAPLLNPPSEHEPVPAPGDIDSSPVRGAPRLRVAVPADITAVKAAGRDRVLAWRLNVREAMSEALDAGYRAVDVVPGAKGVTFYVLERREEAG